MVRGCLKFEQCLRFAVAALLFQIGPWMVFAADSATPVPPARKADCCSPSAASARQMKSTIIARPLRNWLSKPVSACLGRPAIEGHVAARHMPRQCGPSIITWRWAAGTHAGRNQPPTIPHRESDLGPPMPACLLRNQPRERGNKSQSSSASQSRCSV